MYPLTTTQCVRARLFHSIENKIALWSDDGKSNFSDNFTVLRFLVNRVVGKRIWPAVLQDGGGGGDDDKPTLKLESVFLSKSENIQGLLVYCISACTRFFPSLFCFLFATKCTYAENEKWISYNIPLHTKRNDNDSVGKNERERERVEWKNPFAVTWRTSVQCMGRYYNENVLSVRVMVSQHSRYIIQRHLVIPFGVTFSPSIYYSNDW